MTKREVKRLSILKWRIITDGGGDGDWAKNKELKNLFSGCAYCHKYKIIKRGVGGVARCIECPLSKIGKGCISGNSLFNRWFRNRTVKNAQAMLDAIGKS